MPRLYVGTAGWTIPRILGEEFPLVGSHLFRYAKRFNGVEINSSFYRLHKPTTYARWAETVPEDFRFSVKVPRHITHDMRLENAEAILDEFLLGVNYLKMKLGVFLVQLPPSLAFKTKMAATFFKAFRDRDKALIVCEPRHSSWFTEEAEVLLSHFGISRVAADPALLPNAAVPGGLSDIMYYRLHGSPEIYRSPYSEAFISDLAKIISSYTDAKKICWCIYDNTTFGAATDNALKMSKRLSLLI